jgi:hypothetical protein
VGKIQNDLYVIPATAPTLSGIEEGGSTWKDGTKDDHQILVRGDRDSGVGESLFFYSFSRNTYYKIFTPGISKPIEDSRFHLWSFSKLVCSRTHTNLLHTCIPLSCTECRFSNSIQ